MSCSLLALCGCLFLVNHVSALLEKTVMIGWVVFNYRYAQLRCFYNHGKDMLHQSIIEIITKSTRRNLRKDVDGIGGALLLSSSKVLTQTSHCDLLLVYLTNFMH